MRPIIKEFEIRKSTRSYEENSKAETKMKAVLIELDTVLEELRNCTADDLKHEEGILFSDRITRLLNIMLKSNFSMFFQVQISFVVKNIIDMMISLYEYFYMPNGKRPKIRRQTMSAMKLKEMEKSKKLERSKASLDNSGLAAMDQQMNYLQSNEQWTNMINLVTRLCTKYQMVYNLVSDEFTLFQLCSLFPKPCLRCISFIQGSMLVNSIPQLVESIHLTFLTVKWEDATVFQKKTMRLSFIYVLDIFKKLVGYTRKENSYNY